VAKVLADPTPAARTRWVDLARRRAEESGADADFVVTRAAGESFSVLVIGDPGEGDNSQFAVAYTLPEYVQNVDFGVICSDVIYPTGDLTDYDRKFHYPYRHLRVPVYAVPGNHDWYDGLHGFMHTFCGLDDPDHVPDFGRGPVARLARKLWRTPQQPDPDTDNRGNLRLAAERPRPDPVQPASYFAIDAGPIRFVGIDTGIRGTVDAAQYEWLQRVSLEVPERPKVLLTGKPIYVNGEYRPGRVIGAKRTVDDVVTDPRANFVLAIGGDIHNYQRYPVRVPDGRTIQYVVSGGGGAYMHATHTIPPVQINGVTEEQFRCYPLRRDSLARFSQIVDKRLFGGRQRITVEATSAARYYADRGIVSRAARPAAQRLSRSVRIKAAIVRRIPAGRTFHRFGSELFDFNDPPFFKQFLRLDVNQDRLTVTCFGVTGCAGTECTPSVEDRFTIRW
jgi:hypothetical protein